VLGSAYFHSKEFIVTKDVLIPRPDTEVLVETVLKLEKAQHCFFADIGIGSGAIAASIALQRPSWTALGVDISFPALKIAKKNCPEHVFLCAADVFSAFKPQAVFDFIVSNPPYIAESEKQNLDSSVIDFEPHVALFDNADGLTFYKMFVKQANAYLKPGGSIYCEIGYSQGKDVAALFANNGWADVKTLPDLAGRDRVLVAKKNQAAPQVIL
jgi:release factor glutamine methyltransferase